MKDYAELVKKLRDDNACLSVKTLHEAADAIEDLIDMNVGKWIPVGEKLPEMLREEQHIGGESLVYQCSEPVLVWLGGGGDFMAIGVYEKDDGDAFWSIGGSSISCVTHWMPLPAPQGEEQT